MCIRDSAAVPHYGAILEREGFRILLAGDCAIAAQELADFVDGASIDLAVLPFPWITLPRGRAFVEQVIRACLLYTSAQQTLGRTGDLASLYQDVITAGGFRLKPQSLKRFHHRTGKLLIEMCIRDRSYTRWEKRGIASEVPWWDAEKCIQCNRCAAVCSHAVIRPTLLSGEEAAAAPQAYPIKRANGFQNLQYHLCLLYTSRCV